MRSRPIIPADRGFDAGSGGDCHENTDVVARDWSRDRESREGESPASRSSLPSGLYQ
jgi:hypothetical protein